MIIGMTFITWGSCTPGIISVLILKQLGIFFLNIILFSNVVSYKCNSSVLVQNNEYLVSTGDIGCLVL